MTDCESPVGSGEDLATFASQEEIPMAGKAGQILAGADGKFTIGHDSCDRAYVLSDEKQVTRNRRSSQL